MYGRILLASDNTHEGLVALREGALLARSCGAFVFLLVVERDSVGMRVADGVYPLPENEETRRLLEFGLKRLGLLGVSAQGGLVVGDPVTEISRAAKRFGAELVVVGHRRQTLLERWWSGASGAYLVDHVGCSVLVARHLISDAGFETALESHDERRPSPVSTG